MPRKKKNAGWTKIKYKSTRRKNIHVILHDTVEGLKIEEKSIQIHNYEDHTIIPAVANIEEQIIIGAPVATSTAEEDLPDTAETKKRRKVGIGKSKTIGESQKALNKKIIQDVLPSINVSEDSIINARELNQPPFLQRYTVIRGTRSQNNECYSQLSKNKQCTPIAVVAIAFSKVFPFNSWNSSVIDNILDYGDRLYRKSVELRISENVVNMSSHPYLMLQEVYSKFIISTCGYHVIFDETKIITGRVGVKSENPFSILAEGLPQFFKKFYSAVFTCCSLSVSICKSSIGYYLFDSHSCDANGRSVEYGGTACLIKFWNDGDLLSFLLQNYPANEQYTLSPIEVQVESTATLMEEDT